MGEPKFSRKKYEMPLHPWDIDRIKHENELIKKYGLKNKKEVWKTESMLRNFRRRARKIFPLLRAGNKQSEKEANQLLMKLKRLGILPEEANLDDVLTLTVENILTRRFQTMVYVKGLAKTINEARQFIVHGHIAVDNRKVTIPGYIVEKEKDDKIGYYYSSSIVNENHPLRIKKG